jgi:hypothetical protein
MAVQRRVNFLSQSRVDRNDLLSVESAVSNDFDQIFQGLVTGPTQGYILRGFEISMAGAIGGAASALNLLVANSAIIHVTASQSGSLLQTPASLPSQPLNSATNTQVSGSFAASAINYVGLDLARSADAATSSTVYLWSPASLSETAKVAPRGIILNFKVVISTSGFAANVLPIATVTTDTNNNVASITDSRWSLFRLGQGGASPNPFYTYPWSQGRSENPSSSSSNSIDPFSGGDKAIGTLKDWMNAIMSSLQEINGGTYWYSQSTSGSLSSLREDLGNTIVTGNSAISHSKTAAGQINWQSNPTGTGQIHLKVVGSRLDYQIAENPAPGTAVTLAENQVAYITLVRGAGIAPNLSFVTNTSANTTVVTSIGNVAWTAPLLAGDFLKAAADSDSNYFKILSVDSVTQVTLSGLYNISNLTSSGVPGQYAFGQYTLPGSTGSSRDIVITARENVPVGQNVVWLLLRSDDGGGTPRVYVKFLGAELQQGDTEEISGPQLANVLTYIGSPFESATAPQYVSALNPGAIAQVVTATTGDASTISTSQYFFLDSAARQYYVWFKKDGVGTDPAAPGTNASIVVPITTGMTASQVAAALTSALNNTFYGDFSAAQGSGANASTVTITNTSAGAAGSPANFNVGAPFTVALVTSGTGQGNTVITDGDSLTLAIKKLDDAVGNFTAALNSPNYDETVTVVSSGATPPTTITAPALSGTSIALPNNTRLANVVQKYTTGKGALIVQLNGQALNVGLDYTEDGAPGASSNSITTLRNLVSGDVLTFRILVGGGGGGGGGGGQGPQGVPGPAGVNGLNGSQTPVAISTKSSNYTVLSSDCFMRGNCTSNPVQFTLPAASTVTGRMFYFKKVDSSINAMSIVANGSELIDGLGTISTTTQNFSFSIISSGSGWDQF